MSNATPTAKPIKGYLDLFFCFGAFFADWVVGFAFFRFLFLPIVVFLSIIIL